MSSKQSAKILSGEELPVLGANAAAKIAQSPAGFWIRLIAGMIDLVILIVPFAIFVSFSAAALGISNPFFNHRAGTPLNDTLRRLGPAFLALCTGFFALQSLLYFALSESSAWRATLGKRLFGVYVADVHGKQLDFWRAALRFCSGRLLLHVPVIGGYYFLFDCLYVGLTARKRALHDLLSGCAVFRESRWKPRQSPFFASCVRTRVCRWQVSHACTTTLLHAFFAEAYTDQDSLTGLELCSRCRPPKRLRAGLSFAFL